MGATPLLWLSPSEVPPLPTGWQALPTEQVVDALKPGPLYENKTVQQTGAVPVVSQSETEFLGYHNDAPGVVATPDAPVVTFTNHTCALRLMKQPFSCIQNVFPKVGKPGVCDTTYFYYAAQNRVVLTDYKGHHPLFRQAHIPVPPLPIQRRIASILSAYDDLIENNRKRIAILEEMARRLYREWFVHFRYPGHESIPLVDSPLGRIPQGWRAVLLSEAISFNPRPTVSLTPVPFVPMNCLTSDSMIIDSLEERNEPTGARFQNGDTLLARITPCLENGKTAFVQCLREGQVACGSTEFIVMRSRLLCPELVYLLARSQEFRAIAIKSMSGATGRQRVQEASLTNRPIACPPTPLCDRFSAIARPWFQLCENLHRQNSTLRRTRDLLLPRLMSGQLSVTAAEAVVP